MRSLKTIVEGMSACFHAASAARIAVLRSAGIKADGG